jgi:hypothetical protein
MEPEMNSTTSQADQPRARVADLDQRYGKIGISAVAAAVRYTTETKAASAAERATPPQARWLEDLAA